MLLAAILEIYYALLLLNRKANLSGNQVSDTGPSLPSCFFGFFFCFCLFVCLFVFFFCCFFCLFVLLLRIYAITPLLPDYLSGVYHKRTTSTILVTCDIFVQYLSGHYKRTECQSKLKYIAFNA